jgi:putative DNA primase/helicase
MNEPMRTLPDFKAEVHAQWLRASAATGSPVPYGGTHDEAARLFQDTFGHELRWVGATKRWWLCSRTSRRGYWSEEHGDGAFARARAICQQLHAAGRVADKGLDPRFIEGVLRHARAGLAARPTDFNAEPWLLGTPGTVVDLRTGATMPVDPALLLTQCTAVPFEPDATCETWLDHLRVLSRTDERRDAPGDPELVAHLQELVGLSLVGRQIVHNLVYLYGAGRNGKGVFLDTIRYVLGDYGDVLDQTVLFSSADAHTTGLADLQGRRFVMADEVTGTRKINTPLLKKLTGGSRVKARRMRQDNVTFEPTHSLWLASNDHPNFGLDQSEGLWDRVLIVETGPTIPPAERMSDEALRQQLLAEGPGILRWAVEGVVRFVERGNQLPETPLRVRAATDALRREASLVDRFLDEFGVKGGEDTLLKDFRGQLERWARREGLLGRHDTLGSRAVADLLRQRRIVVEPGARNQRVVRGWALRQETLSDLRQ